MGANIGFFSLAVAAAMEQQMGHTGHVIAVEPLLANARLLKRSVKANRFDKRRIRIVRAAAGDDASAGELLLLAPPPFLSSQPPPSRIPGLLLTHHLPL